MRSRKHRARTTLPSGKFVGCDGRLVTLYARTAGPLRSVGAICLRCGEITLDGYPEDVWERRGLRRDLAGQPMSAFESDALDDDA
jgi:hypothetical protein